MAMTRTSLSDMTQASHLGTEMHIKALDGIEKLRCRMEQQLTWIDEALIEARKTFSSPQIYLIPKTPSTKRTRRMAQITEDEESVDSADCTERVQKKKKKQRPAVSRRARAAGKADHTMTTSSQDDSLGIETEHETSESDQAGASGPVYNTRGNRNPAVIQSGVHSTRTMCTSASDEDDIKKQSVVIRNNALFSEVGDDKMAMENREESLPSNVTTDVDKADIQKCAPVVDHKQSSTVIMSNSEDEDRSDEHVSLMEKVKDVSAGQSSLEAKRQDSSHIEEKSPVDSDSAKEEMPNFHLLKVKEKASKFEELANRNSDSHDYSSDAVAHSPKPPTLVTKKLGTPLRQLTVSMPKPDVEAAKQAFEKLLGVSVKASKTHQVRRSSRRLSQKVSLLARKSLEYRTKNTSGLLQRKMQLLNAVNANSNTCNKISPIPMRTTRSKMRAALANQKPDNLGDLTKTVMSSSDDEVRTPPHITEMYNSRLQSKRVVAPDSEDGDGSSDPDCLRAPLPGRTTRSKMNRQLEKENYESQVHSVKRHATSKPPQFSFLTQTKKKPTVNIISGMTSFLQRNTPPKKTTVDIIELKRQQLLAKEEEARVRRMRVQEQKQREAEEKRRNREQRQALAAERRKEQCRKKQEMTEKELKRDQEKMLHKAKILEQKQQEEKERHKFREVKLEENRKREAERQREKHEFFQEQEVERQRLVGCQLRKKEYEQQLRQKQIQENRQRNEEHLHELGRERQFETERLQQAQQKRDKEREIQLKEKQDREKLERAEREKHELEKEAMHNRQVLKEREMEQQQLKQEQAKAKDVVIAIEREKQLQKQSNELKENPVQNAITKPAVVDLTTAPYVQTAEATQPSSCHKLNSTFNKDESTVTANPDTYDMTPDRKVYSKCCSTENYNIDDIRSDDSTDDEERPRKKIPSWASGAELKALLITQYYTPPDLDSIFSVIETPNLCEMFSKKKPKFFKRTSSAVWSSPMYLPSGKPYNG